MLFSACNYKSKTVRYIAMKLEYAVLGNKVGKTIAENGAVKRNFQHRQ